MALDDYRSLENSLSRHRAAPSQAKAQARLAAHGPNQLASKPPRPAWLKFLDQFRNFLVIALLGAAALADAVGDLKDELVIPIVVLTNATLGFFQEHRAEAALVALKNMLAPIAHVRRNGHATLIPAVDLLPGDIRCLKRANASRPMPACSMRMRPRWRRRLSPASRMR